MNHDRTKSAAVVNENDRLLGVVNRHKFFEIPESIVRLSNWTVL